MTDYQIENLVKRPIIFTSVYKHNDQLFISKQMQLQNQANVAMPDYDFIDYPIYIYDGKS